MAEPPDAEALAPLLARVREHDEAASRALVERLYPLVARVVRANLPRRDEPEDLMQEVFFKMFSKLEQFRGEVPFEHWVSRIALTTCLDQLRRQKVRPELRWADLSEEDQFVLESVAAAEEPSDADAPRALELLNRLLDQLPATDAWLLRRVELEQKTLADVCAETGWNGGAARVRLFRARRRLQQQFRQLEKKS
jgi:RNA polymerase sigma-70 factor (ECF subfamily)